MSVSISGDLRSVHLPQEDVLCHFNVGLMQSGFPEMLTKCCRKWFHLPDLFNSFDCYINFFNFSKFNPHSYTKYTALLQT